MTPNIFFPFSKRLGLLGFKLVSPFWRYFNFLTYFLAAIVYRFLKNDHNEANDTKIMDTKTTVWNMINKKFQHLIIQNQWLKRNHTSGNASDAIRMIFVWSSMQSLRSKLIESSNILMFAMINRRCFFGVVSNVLFWQPKKTVC